MSKEDIRSILDGVPDMFASDELSTDGKTYCFDAFHGISGLRWPDI